MSGKTIALSVLLGLAFFAGLFEHSLANSEAAGRLSTGHLLISVALIFAWFYMDSQQRDYKSSIALKLCVAGLTVFALPYYLFRSRGARAGIRAMGMTVLIFIAAMVFYRFGTWASP